MMDQMQKIEDSLSTVAAKPVFILGIRHRSGTNMLLDVLVRHPSCVAHSDPEDFLVSCLRDINKYVGTLEKKRRSKQFRSDNRQELSETIGEALLRYITKNIKAEKPQVPVSKRVITKTPSVQGLQYFREIFPDAYLILLIRDGRSVVESAVRSFGADFDLGCRRYATAANIIASFMGTDPNPDKTILMRFEDYIGNKRKTVETLLRFLGLSTETFPFEDLELMPVRGSSELKQKEGDSIHWKPMAAKISFDPRHRYSEWSEFQHSRFDWLAGEALEKMGYERSRRSSSLFFVRNIASDVYKRLNSFSIRRKVQSSMRDVD